jgi:DNA-binding response OmpR family regulator
MGVVDFITKPFFGPVLLGRVKKHLQMEDKIRELQNKIEGTCV